jgi:3-ketosteroid 9alpha-monooxygenase subunit A
MIKKPRFPLPRYPQGWFQVAYSDEIAPGQVKAIRYFGKDLALFRTESGQVHVIDAFCPHLGAHLGVNGVVKGEEIQCPFHAWRFNGQGTCTAVPYATIVPKKAKVGTWHVREINTAIMVWHDIDSQPPTWELPHIPEFFSDEFSQTQRKEWKLRTHNQEMAENVVDSAHFKYVHGTLYQPATTIEAVDHLIHMVSPTIVRTPGGDIPGQIESHAYAFGFSTTRFTGMAETLLMGCVAPIDDEYVHVRFTFTVKMNLGADITKGIGRAFVKEISRQLEQDKVIWENKTFLDRPMICDGDGPLALFRRWSKQFYPDWYVEKSRAEYLKAHNLSE